MKTKKIIYPSLVVLSLAKLSPSLFRYLKAAAKLENLLVDFLMSKEEGVTPEQKDMVVRIFKRSGKKLSEFRDNLKKMNTLRYTFG